MTVISWFGVVTSVLSILSFLFAVWVRLKSDIKIKELTSTLQSLHDIADSIIWEAQFVSGEDAAARIAQLEKSLGLASAMRTITSKYVGDHDNYRATELGVLIQRGIIWSNAMLAKVETSSEVREIWLMTQDLEPDLSDKKTGDLVKRNLAAGKKYVYFYPSNLQGAESKIRGLRRNIGADNRKHADSIRLIPIDDVSELQKISPANVILFFRDKSEYGTQLVFQEVVLTKFPKRGRFWQEHDQQYATRVFECLRQELRTQNNRTDITEAPQ